jgi:plasmid stabilization system protein ParE
VKLVVQPEAEADIVDASIWYDRQSKIVRENFLSTLYATLNVIERHPLQYQTFFGQVRRVMVRGFPYALLYLVSDDVVNVLACFHTSRDPKRWQDRIPQ